MAGFLWPATIKQTGQAPTELAGFRAQSSVYGLPIPIIYGLARVAANMIHLVDATSELVTTDSRSGNKKIHVQSSQNTYRYTAALALGLCEGQIGGPGGQPPIGNVWRDKEAPVQFTAVYQPAGWSVFDGSPTQSPWSYLTTNHPSEAVPYQSVAYVVFPGLELSDNVLSSYSWEINGLLPFLGPGNNIFDANPADVFPDLLTNVQYGLALPSARIGSLTSFYQYCGAAGLFFSPVYDAARPASDIVSELLQAANCALVWSDGVFKVIPYGDQPLSGNGQTYTPNTTPEYDLTDADFLAPPGTDPVVVTRIRAADAYNRVVVEFENRANLYAPEVQEAKDQNAIELYGLRSMPSISLSLIKDADTARLVAQLVLQRVQAIRNTYTFKLGWRYSLLESMDLVTLTDVGLGMSLTPVRLTSVTELANEQGIQCEAEDWPFGIATATRYATQSGNGFAPDTGVDPGDTQSAAIFEGPRALDSDPLTIYIGASGGPFWGGADVYVSTDNVTFQKFGTIPGRATYGTLTAGLAAGPVLPSVDTTHTLAVDVSPSEGQLVTYSTTDFNRLTPLCYVGGEWLAYKTATLTGSFAYNLTTLGRGALGTPNGGSAHSSGAAFVFIDQNVYQLPWPKGRLGDVLYFKFPAFNSYGLAAQDVSTVPTFTHTIGQEPSIGVAQLQVEITQSASADSTAVFTVKVIDPLNFGGTCTVTPDFQGISALHNDTLGLAAAPFTATIGTAYQFTATLFPPWEVASGYAKFHATKTGWADGWGLWYTSAASQDAEPAMVIAIGNNQSATVFTAKASAVVNAPSNTDHILWLASTSSQPSQGSVIATGATVSGGGPFTIADLGVNLNLGDTVYLSVQPVDSLGRFTSATFVQGKKTRESIVASKTAFFAVSSFVRMNVPLPTTDTVSQAPGGDYIQAGFVSGQSLPQSAMFGANFTLPQNSTVTSISGDVYRDTNSISGQSIGALYGATFGNDIYGAGALATVTAPNTAAWSTQTASLSQSTTGYRFLMAHFLITSASIGNEDVRFRAYSITYTSADTQASL